MDTLLPEVYASLQSTGYAVAYSYPTKDMALPCLSYYEINNREHAQAGGNEFATEVQYQIDCWAANPETLMTMGSAVDSKLALLRLKRQFSLDLFETDTGIYHKTMRYRAIIHIGEQKIYQ